MSEVVVNGTRGVSNTAWYDSYGIWEDNVANTDPPSLAVPITLLSVPDFCPTVPTTSEQTQHKMDTLAAEITRTIQTQPDVNSREYFAIIYRETDGTIRSTPIAAGDDHSSVASTVGITDYGGQVLAFVHNHPDHGRSPSQPSYVADERMSITMYDSSGAPFGDIYAMEDSVNNRGVNAAEFRSYIIGPDGELRKYDYNNRATMTPTTPLDKTAGLCS